MKCSKCNSTAFVWLNYANLALCKKHFVEYYERKLRTSCEKQKIILPEEHVLVAVSGGKDSIALLYALKKVCKDNKLTALFINLGIPEYSSESERIVKKLCQEINVPLVVYNLKNEIGKTLVEVAKKRRKICSACGTVKRYVMNKIANDINADIIATGHTLYDTAAFAFRNFMLGAINEMKKLVPRTTTTKELKLIGKAKPLYEFSEYENLLYCIANNLDFIDYDCPFSEDTPIIEWKRFLFQFDKKHPGSVLKFVRYYPKNVNLLFDKSNIEKKVTQNKMKIHFCSKCGMPTTQDVCSFCKLTGE